MNIPEYPNAERVFYFFEEISKIPHTSSNTELIADYLTEFAKERGLEYVRDEKNNVIIRKGATRGYEDHPTVILQGHTDMVADKLDSLDIDMSREPITVFRDGDFIKADGTTLGADDGIALAYALAILDSEDIEHPSLEAVFTSDEEIGLLGAKALDGTKLSGRLLINIDSDREGVFTVGCAGGVIVELTLPYKKQAADGKFFELSLRELRGGHSGVEIGCGAENAIKLLFEILAKLPTLSIADISGGNADNAIPRVARAVFKTDAKKAEIEAITREVLSKYKDSEPNAKAALSEVFGIKECYTVCDSLDTVAFITRLPNGVRKMSEDIEGLVETSSNLGVAGITGGRVKLSICARSSKNDERVALTESFAALAEEYGADIKTSGEYPAWEYRPESRLRDTLCRVYREAYKKEPRVEIIHAGLECGIFADKLEGLDCVSLGPDAYDIHTTDERLSISSAARVYEFLIKTLKEL